MEIIISDATFSPPLELDIKSGVGQGIRSVISFTLQLYFILTRGAYPVLFLDETYSGVSDLYRERFFSFVSSLAKAKGMAVVFVTHVTEVQMNADKVYVVNDGVVSELEEKKDG